MAVSTSSGAMIYADTSGLNRLARNLRAAAPRVWLDTRVALKAAGDVIADDAKKRASYSSRIPDSIVTVVRGGSVKVRAGVPNTGGVVDTSKATNAAALENRGKGNPRHPLFGDREHWYTNTTTPAFLNPAADAHRDEAAAMVLDAVTRGVERAVAEATV